ncbi:ABC transporter ATP-binding protein [Mogibacterium sp. NSJ-24]|uniref:ABC transporter ATP-binding protein n=1 Tax=Lentihominibacter hominis TaxID=2763645 RepID=A0A926IA57_9FIRM|nr:ABC transporter ATP-binding protein [Lentihominibacter hominis]MBC8568863.1 ABC transporter ATP-binding protein [Lentihominibacter hominis]
MIKTLLKSVRQYKKASLASPLLVTVEVIIECFLPLVMAMVIDSMSGNSMTPILKYGLMLVIMAMFSLLFGVLAGREAATASCGFAKNLRQDMYFKIQDFAFADMDKFSTSSLVTRMTTDVTNVQNAYQMIIRAAIRTPLMMIFSVIMSMTINVKMACIFLVTIPVLGIALFGIVLYVHPIFKRIFKKYDAMNNSVQENIAGIRVVKSFVREDYEAKKFGKASEDVRKDFTRAEKILAFNNPVMMFCIYMSMLLISYFGARIIIGTGAVSLTTGELSSLISYGVQILAAMMVLSMVFVMTIMAEESANRIAEVLTQESSLQSPENGIRKVKNGKIDFENVSFCYSKASKKKALSNINLTINPGETIGIIGGTGSAKTTLIQLISRLYDVTEGSVKVGGIDVRKYDLEALRNEVAVVLQKNVLFSGTIKENLRWGKKDADEEELIRVCRLAQADEFIQQFPKKYDTYIEQGGTNVSGGQKQRLCIARALLKKPKILILDDSTSAVDTKTDALIRKAMSEEIPDTTKIIIAQRVSSVEDADKIIVMDGGRIAQQGTHRQLLAADGIYREVYDSQTRSKEVE